MIAFKLAFRSLRKRPALTLAAVSTLAVGIGATTAIFSALNATVFRPLPYDRPEDLYTLTSTYTDGRWSSGTVAEAYVTAAASAPSVVGAVGWFDQQWALLGDDGASRQATVVGVGRGFFELFGLEVQEGRALVPEDYNPGDGLNFAIISDRLWLQMFGRDPAVVGRTLRTLGAPFTIVGVAHPEFDVPESTDVWYAASSDPNGRTHGRDAYLRTMPGITHDRLEEELTAAMLGVIEEFPETAGGRVLVATNLSESIVGDLEPMLFVLLAGSVVLLLLSCANVATLMLGRGVARRRELAVSSAQGASRSQIALQFAGEAFLLSATGALVGFGLAAVGLRVFRAAGAADFPRMSEVPLDFTVLGFAAATLVASTLLVGLLPAIQLSDPSVRTLLSDGGGTSGGKRVRRSFSGFVMFEIVLGVAVLSIAGWLARSYVNLAETDPGFVAEGRLVFDALLEGSSYGPQPDIIVTPEGLAMIDPEWVPSATPQLWRERLQERLLAMGQTTKIASAETIPFGSDEDIGWYVATSADAHDVTTQEVVQERRITVGFFEAMGMRILAGRTFETGDQTVPGVVVNEEFARRFFAGRDPVGSTFFRGFPTPNFQRPMPVIGVVSDVRYESLEVPAGPAFYIPVATPNQSVVVSTSSEDPMALAPSILEIARELDPTVPLEVRSLEAILNEELLVHRVGLVLMASFAVLALVLIGIGIYGAVAHSTGQRSRELATRMAFGADASTVSRLILSEAAVVASSGIALGIALAYAAGRIVATAVYGANPEDPVVLGSAAAIVLGVTLVAYSVPAFRAPKMVPTVALRE